jgi:hypothetical protein
MYSRRAASEFPNDNPELHDGLVWQSDSVTGHALPTLRLRQLTGRMPKVLGPSWDERAKPVVRAPRTEVPVIGRPPFVHRPSVVECPPIVESARETVAADAPSVEPLEGLGWVPVAADAMRESVAEAAPSVESDATRESVVATEPPVEADAVATERHAPMADPAPAPALTAFEALLAALVRVTLDRGATRVAAELPALLSGGRGSAGFADSPRARSLVALGPAWRSALDGGDLAGCGDQPLDVWASELLATLLTAPGEREALRRALRRHGVAAFGMLIAV